MTNFKLFNSDLTGLKNETIAKINSVFKKFAEIDKVIIYGSRAKGNYSNGSDIDLCFTGNRVTSDLILQIDNSLDELMLPYTFDLSIYELIENSDFKEHINRVGMIFFKHQS